jgi:hypothetical protein
MPITDNYGVALGLYPSDTLFDLELQRAPDLSGAPDVASAAVLAALPGTQPVYVDQLPNDGVPRWYSIRHVRTGWTSSALTDWFRAVPARLFEGYGRNPLPAVGLVSAPSPWFDATTQDQKGFLAYGLVNETTAGLFIQATSVGAVTCVPAATALTIGGVNGLWLDLSGQNSFLLQVLVDPGVNGSLVLTPYAHGDTAARGLHGDPVTVPLGRHPISTLSWLEDTASSRRVTLKANPGTATIRYKINDGSWVEAVGSVEFRVDVSQGSQSVQWYAVANGLAEPVHAPFTFDANLDPEIRPGSGVTESPANNVLVQLNLDDDVKRVAVWARRVNAGGAAAWPVMDGTTDVPDDRFLKNLTWYAEAGDWYVIVRAYGNREQYVEARYTITVVGSATAVGALSALAASLVTVSATNYVELDWGYNSVVDASTLHDFAFTVREDGVEVLTLATNRDPREEPSVPVGSHGIFASPDGGVRLERAWVASGTSGAVANTWNYEVRLYHLGAYVASYNCTVSGYVVGGGGGGSSAPTDSPSTPTLDYIGEDSWTATWGNSRTDLALEIEWAFAFPNGSGFPYSLPAGTDQDSNGNGGSSQARARVRYVNDYGAGPWSNWSPWRNNML